MYWSGIWTWRDAAQAKSVHMTLAQRGSSMIHRTLPHTRVSRGPRYAQEHPRGTSPGGAPADTGRAAPRAVRLSAGPPYPAVVRGGAQADNDRRGPLLLAPQRVSDCTRLSRGDLGPGARRPRETPATRAHHRARPYAAPVAAGPAQGTPAGVWLVPHALELCHAGPDATSQARRHDLGRDDAALAPRDRLGVEA